jgi:aminotransferase
LRRAIAYYLAGRYRITYNPEREILVTVGASEGIDLALRTILSPGDEVLVPEPSYVSYSPGVLFAGGTPIAVKTDQSNAFKLTAKAILEKVTPRTKALILPYPNNPTGAIMERSDLLSIAQAVRENNILVISDEIYSELTYGPEPHASFAGLPDMWERTVTINGFSKAFAMTGWRMGYVCAPAPIIAAMFKIHQYAIMCAPRQGQVAAEQALRAGRENNYEDVVQMRISYDRRRRLMVDAFRKMDLNCFEPLGAFYVFPSIRKTGLTSEEFCTQLLNRYQVACVPGTAFGQSGEGHIRCCYATALNKLGTALDRIEAFVHEL